MLHWTIAAARHAGADRVVASIRPDEGVEEALPEGVIAAPQTTGEGTGAAVLAARDHVEPGQTVVSCREASPSIPPGLICWWPISCRIT